MNDITRLFGCHIDDDTTADHRLYDICDFGRADALARANGYKVREFSFPHNPPKPLRRYGYAAGYLWIYDPSADGGAFRFADRTREFSVAYTREWRVFHELGHAITEHVVQTLYGPSRRLGALTHAHTYQFAKGPVTVRPLTLMEAKRALAWEAYAFKTQREVMASAGIRISDADYAQEYNVNMYDATIRVLTGEFSDPGIAGFLPHHKIIPLADVLREVAEYVPQS